MCAAPTMYEVDEDKISQRFSKPVVHIYILPNTNSFSAKVTDVTLRRLVAIEAQGNDGELIGIQWLYALFTGRRHNVGLFTSLNNKEIVIPIEIESTTSKIHVHSR